MKTRKGTLQGFRAFSVAIAAGALSLGFLAFMQGPASTAPLLISDASFSWGVNDLSGAGAAGYCNFLVAGEAGDTGKSVPWDTAFAEHNYKTSAGNVTITKPTADGLQEEPTWSTRCSDPMGKKVSPVQKSVTQNRVNITN